MKFVSSGAFIFIEFFKPLPKKDDCLRFVEVQKMLFYFTLTLTNIIYKFFFA